MSGGEIENARGSATILMVSVIGLIVTVAMVAVAIGVATETRHRAVAAADAAALAAAADVIDGPGAACARGRSLAVANGGRLVSCLVTGSIVEVKVATDPPGLLARFGAVVARARAGPAGAH